MTKSDEDTMLGIVRAWSNYMHYRVTRQTENFTHQIVDTS